MFLNKASIWGLRPDFYYNQTVAGLSMWGAFSDERTGLSFTVLAGPRQRSHSLVQVPRDSRPYFTVSGFETSFFIASYDSQSYGGGIRPILHTGVTPTQLTVYHITSRIGPHGKHRSSIALQLFPREHVYLRSRCSAPGHVYMLILRSVLSSVCTCYIMFIHHVIQIIGQSENRNDR
jgi:hypothetical protein